MTTKEALDVLEGVYAYESGATDSGIRDRVRQKEAANHFDALDERAQRFDLSRWVRTAYLSEGSLMEGYGWEDALGFLRWIEEGEYRV